MIYEDFERLRDMDEMYLIEAQKEMEEEWKQWENRLPAEITIIDKTKENDTSGDLQKRIERIP